MFTNYHISRQGLPDEDIVVFQQHPRRVYAQDDRGQMKRKADHNNHCRQR